MGAMVWKEQKRMKEKLEQQQETLARIEATVGKFAWPKLVFAAQQTVDINLYP